MNIKLRLTIVSLSVLTRFEVSAQTEKCENFKNLLPVKYEAYKSANIVNRTTAKKTASIERLIAHSNYSFNAGIYNLNDSSEYTWTGDRTSTQDVYSVGYGDCTSFQNMFSLSGKLRNFQRNLQSFDVLNNKTLIVSQLWDTTTNSWENQIQSIRSFSGTDLLESVEQNWDKLSSAWVNRSKSTTNYSSGKVTEVLGYNWNTSVGSWDKSSRQVINYLGVSITERTIYFWNSSSLSYIPNSRTTYTYLGSDITAVLMENFDGISGVWVNEMQFDNVITGGLGTESYMKLWNKTNAMWDSSYKRISSVLGGKISESITQGWDTSKRIWVNGWKINNDYTGTNLTGSIQLKWDNASADWTKFEKNEYGHNANNNLISNFRYFPEAGTWTLNPIKKFYYYETYTGINEDTPYVSNINVYPNPATTANVYVDYFTQQSEPTNVVLSNVLGQEILRKTEPASIGDHSVMIPVSSLSSGMYVVSIYSNGQLQKTMKLLK